MGKVDRLDTLYQTCLWSVGGNEEKGGGGNVEKGGGVGKIWKSTVTSLC